MSTTCVLLARDRIPRDELIAFLASAGVQIADHPWGTDYTLSRGQQHVWFFLDDEEEDIFNFDYQPSPADMTRIVEALGGMPQTSITLEVSTNPFGDELAADFVLHFAQRWLCVVDNVSGFAPHIFTVPEIREQRKVGHVFVAPNEREAPDDELLGVTSTAAEEDDLGEVDKPDESAGHQSLPTEDR